VVGKDPVELVNTYLKEILAVPEKDISNLIWFNS
jgi:hypothetical protein